MKASNSLTSHWPESLSSPVQKMSGRGKGFMSGKSRKSIKKFYGRKRRRILNNKYYYDKIR